jgi:hypothetical protein
MNKLKKYAVRIVLLINLATVVVAVAAAIYLFVPPTNRYNVFRLSSELPGIVTYFSIRKSVIARDFSAAANYLDRHLRWSTTFGVEQSTLLPALIENTEFVVRRAEFSGEFTSLVPYLQRLQKTYPNLFLPNLWLGQALANSQPEKAFAALELAVKRIPSDERTYRYAIDAALALQDTNHLTNWCAKYKSSQLGGPHPYAYNTLFTGTGLRKMMLEGQDAESKSLLVENRGVELNTQRRYGFTFPSKIAADELKLYLGTVPSTYFDLKNIVYHTDNGMIELGPDQLIMTSQYGYVLNPDRLMLTGLDGDRITIRSSAQRIEWVKQVEIVAEISRPHLTNHPACLTLK